MGNRSAPRRRDMFTETPPRTQDPGFDSIVRDSGKRKIKSQYLDRDLIATREAGPAKLLATPSSYCRMKIYPDF